MVRPISRNANATLDRDPYTLAMGVSVYEAQSRARRTYTMPRSLCTIATEISRDWKNVQYSARPYLEALHALDNVSQSYHHDSGKSIVRYFLGNASTWRGPVAKRIKAELKGIVK
mgnify:CR=1 FL=1